MNTVLADLSHPLRGRLEECVIQVFRRAYGAEVRTFLPRLFGAFDAESRPFAVVGTRRADEGTLFVESYLDVPVETELRRAVGRPVRRAAVAEVGNLAARRRGEGERLVVALARLLHEEGVEWAVFAGTAALVRRFERLGYRPVDLGAADGARLGDARTEWGGYYESAPRVAAVLLRNLLMATEAAA